MAQIRVVELDENTRIPLRVIWVVGSAAMGGVIWLTVLFVTVSTMKSDIASASAKIEGIEKDRVVKRDEFKQDLYEIKVQLARISERLGIRKEEP